MVGGRLLSFTLMLMLIETLSFLFTNISGLWIDPDRGVSPPEIPRLPLILLQSRGSRPPPEPGPAADLCELRVCVVFSGQFSSEVFTCSARQPHISQKPWTQHWPCMSQKSGFLQQPTGRWWRFNSWELQKSSVWQELSACGRSESLQNPSPQL